MGFLTLFQIRQHVTQAATDARIFGGIPNYGKAFTPLTGTVGASPLGFEYKVEIPPVAPRGVEGFSRNPQKTASTENACPTTTSCTTCGINENELTPTSNPYIFGPIFWKTLHVMAANYPERPTPEQAKKMQQWLQCFDVALPCETCAVHFRAYIKAEEKNLSTITSSREHLFTFLWDLHNRVNARLGKPQMSLEEAKAMYTRA
jgi:hypothetical protein